MRQIVVALSIPPSFLGGLSSPLLRKLLPLQLSSLSSNQGHLLKGGFMVIRRMLLCFVLVMTGSVVLADSWLPISTVDAPTARAAHSAVFTRIDGTDHMIVWGGQDSPMIPFANTGAIYDPFADSWSPTTTVGAPSARDGHTSIWTGSQMLVWGGISLGNYVNDGAFYDPRTDTWTPISTTNAPSPRLFFASGWDSTHLLIWGGFD